MTERFTVDSEGKWWDRITHEYVTLDNLFRTVEELDNKLESKQHTINEMAKTIRIYDDGYIDLNKKYKKLKDENKQLKHDATVLIQANQDYRRENEQLKQQLDYADDLIHSHLSEHFIRQWTNFKMGHKEYNDFWEEKLKKYNDWKGDVE